MPQGEWPNIFSAIQAFGFEFSHSENSSCWQKKQLPQAIGKATTTRSPTFRFLHVRPDLDDLAHELVAEDVALLHRRDEAVVEVQVGAADRRRGDLHDGVAPVQDLRVGHLLDPHVLSCRTNSSLSLRPPYSDSQGKSGARHMRLPATVADRRVRRRAAARVAARCSPRPDSVPSETTTSPISMTCLKRRRSSASAGRGLRRRAWRRAAPIAPPGGL